MKIKVSAYYEATDGSLPSSVDVEVTDEEGETAPITVDEAVTVIGFAIDRLNTLPAQRYAVDRIDLTGATPSVIRTPADNPADACRRTLCGHGRNVHGSADDMGETVGTGNGACSVCHNGDKCRSFVGAEVKA